MGDVQQKPSAGTAIARPTTAPPTPLNIAVLLYAGVRQVFSGRIKERLSIAAKERNPVRRMHILDAGLLQSDLDQALYDVSKAVSSAFAVIGPNIEPFAPSRVYEEAKPLLSALDGTFSTLRAISSEAGIAAQTRKSSGAVAGAVMGSKMTKGGWGVLIGAGLGSAMDSSDQQKRVMAVIQRFDSVILGIDQSYIEVWRRVFDKVLFLVGTALSVRMPAVEQVEENYDRFLDSIEKATALHASGDHDGAHAALDDALRICPIQRDALVISADLGLQRGETDRALALTELVVKTDPSDAGALAIQAEAMTALGQSEAACQALRKAEGATDHNNLLKAAAVSERLGHADIALRLRERAASLVPFILPECADAVASRCRAYVESKKPKGVKLASDMPEEALSSVRKACGWIESEEVPLFAYDHTAFATMDRFTLVTNARIVNYGGDIFPHEIVDIASVVSEGKTARAVIKSLRGAWGRGTDDFCALLDKEVFPALGRWTTPPELPPPAESTGREAQLQPAAIELSPSHAQEPQKKEVASKPKPGCLSLLVILFGVMSMAYFMAIPALALGLMILLLPGYKAADRRAAKVGMALAVAFGALSWYGVQEHGKITTEIEAVHRMYEEGRTVEAIARYRQLLGTRMGIAERDPLLLARLIDADATAGNIASAKRLVETGLDNDVTLRPKTDEGKAILKQVEVARRQAAERAE